MANIFDSESPYVINGRLWVGSGGIQIPTAGLQLGPGTATAGTVTTATYTAEGIITQIA